MTQTVAQEYEYVPFVREGVKWVYYYDSPFETVGDEFIPQGRHYYTLELKGDTVIDGKHYKPMHLYSGDAINEESDTIPVYLREENKVVYALAIYDKRYAECPIGIGEDCLVTYNSIICPIVTGQEYILYDFNDPAEFYENHDEYIGPYIVSIGNRLRKCHGFPSIEMFFGGYIIEGIGFAGGNLFGQGATLCYFYPVITGLQVSYRLSHVIENGVIIYRPDDLEQLLEPDDSDGYLSIVREGVKWVNEKVIVNHGDTTRYYYNYEFSGKDTDVQYTNMQNDLFDACYYYLGEQLDVEQDSLIAGLLDNYYGAPGGIACMRNHALAKIRDESRQMFDLFYYLDGGSRKLYDFSQYYSTIHYYVNLCEFMWCLDGGFEPDLTEENFIEVDPVMIEGVECYRYAYIDENGEPLAYVVEGIGFDSRDMGDLLTPFTRQPDHDADYQEWCGLSHVVKDGQIIYKGMRYRHGAFTGIDEAVADGTQRPANPNYYNLMGQPVGQDVPTAPGIYIHQGKKIVVR